MTAGKRGECTEDLGEGGGESGAVWVSLMPLFPSAFPLSFCLYSVLLFFVFVFPPSSLRLRETNADGW